MSGFGDFSFDHVPPAEPLELASEPNRVFEITPDGTVKIHGYTAGEALRLLEGYRQHMIEFARAAHEIQSGRDAFRFRPQDGEPE